MPLKLSLKPGEAVVVNGAVVRNGDRRGVLLLENQARVLREKDVMQPEDADTPVKLAYFSLMQMYLVGETEGPAYDSAIQAIGGILASTDDEATRESALVIARAAAASAGR